MGVPLDPASVLARRAEGEPEVHVTAAADELVKYPTAQPDAFADGGALITLAFAGALAMVTRAELDGSTAAVQLFT